METQRLLFVWLGLSILLALLSQAFLWIFLRYHRIPMQHFFIGTPGYLDAKFIRWCKENDSGYRAVIVARGLLVSSIVLAVLAIQRTV
jgi:hypothetical protein